jgi:RimJ/RimL family protein N-acetyltransferase
LSGICAQLTEPCGRKKKILLTFTGKYIHFQPAPMQSTYKTKRLLLRSLTAADAAFIFELVNTAGWIKFIGDRNVKNREDAGNYIQKIINNPDVEYRVVTLQDEQIAIGVISFIKRNYLQHHDIGFAFLPAFSGKGYAIEAANAVLTNMLKLKEHATILATTLTDNHSSIRLLKKLGFVFSKEIIHEQDTLQLYAINKEKINA